MRYFEKLPALGTDKLMIVTATQPDGAGDVVLDNVPEQLAGNIKRGLEWAYRVGRLDEKAQLIISNEGAA